MSDDFRVDLHVHSKYSPDSHSELEAIAAAVAESGLRGFALTDHNTVRGHAALSELSARYHGFLFIPGVEVSTRDGHLLALGVREAPPRGRALAETVDWVGAHGGVAVLPHPFRRTHGVGRALAASAKVSAIEGRNGHNSELANAHAELVAAQRGIGATGGSDAHRPEEVGRCVTAFPDPVESVEDLLELLHHGQCQAEGRSLAAMGRLRVSLTSGLLRLRRGLRPI